MLSREFLINRKECCGEGCHMCPYSPKHTHGCTTLSSELDDFQASNVNND